jgi:L-alanine-DL-glutamate epimerase-like enolase superfamily enzyme
MLVTNRRSFLRASLGIASAAVAGDAISAALPPAEGRGQLKIRDVETVLLRFPPAPPTADAIHTFGVERGGLVVKIHTDAGITGWGYSSFGMIRGGPNVVGVIVNAELKPALLGQDPFFSKKVRAELWKATEYHGVQGVAQFAIAAVDIALWDVCGKALNVPVYRMLGGFHQAIPAYAMVGWYYQTEEEYKRAIAAAVEEGFKAVKIKVGRGPLEEDIRRIELAKQLVGKDRLVMVDANQVFANNVPEALRRGRAYQQLGVFWYEEPLPPYEREGYAELAAALDIDIATGENLYTKYEFLDYMQHKAMDIVQPDNRRAGGVTEWMEIAALADAFGLRVASHGGGPTNVHMLCSMPNAIYLETGSLKNETTYQEALKLVDGKILAPQTPGMGSELRPEFVEKHRV